MTWSVDDIPNLTGKTAVVTGGNTGIGLETVKQLATKGATVYMASRTESKALAAIHALELENPKIRGRVRYLHIDLTSLKSSIAAAESLKSLTSHLHLVVNNAGIMASPYELTVDGIEIQTATNHFGHFAFTQTLLPLLKSTAEGLEAGDTLGVRVVNVSSFAHNSTAMPFSKPNFTSLQSTNSRYWAPGSKAWQRYSQSKLCQLLYTSEFNRQLSSIPNIYALSAHPGFILSDLWRHTYIPKFIQRLLFLSPAQGSLQQLYAATSTDVATGILNRNGVKSGSLNGAYITPFTKVTRPNKPARDEGLAKELWDLSISVIREKTGVALPEV